MSVELRANTGLPAWRHLVTQAGADAWTRMLDDPNPIHRDARAVAALGLGDRPINPGPANLAYFYNMLEWCFPAGETRTLAARLLGNVYVGDVAEVTGAIVGVEPCGDDVLVRCALELRGGAGAAPAVVASAEVIVPRGGPRT